MSLSMLACFLLPYTIDDRQKEFLGMKNIDFLPFYHEPNITDHLLRIGVVEQGFDQLPSVEIRRVYNIPVARLSLL